ncbi:MAG: Asp-tRNA(Asn)/Glu-tRNA(Gln) amidotransferase subunit GatC [Candidatus Hydrothermales bacterium]
MDLEKEVRRISELARIKVGDYENFSKNFLKILDFFKKIDELNLENESPFFYLEHLRTELRKDEVKEFTDVNLLFFNSPEKKGNFFVAEAPIESD